MTGCSSGVGKTIRKNLIEQGHNIYGVGKNGPDLNADFSDYTYVAGDIERGARSIVQSAEHLIGPVDCLLLNAGMTSIDFLQDHRISEFCKVLQCNLVWPFALTRAFHAEAIKREKLSFKKIVFTGSMADKLAMRGSPSYCASKSGLEALTRQISKELSGKGLWGVYCIAPCSIENTEMSSYVVQRVQETRGMTKEEAEKYCMQSPLGRAATHDEVWKMFDFVVNHAPEAATGSTFYMTAGMGI